MNKYFNRFLILAGCAAVLSACDENSWNDEYLNGFDPDKTITEVKTIDYTLTTDDYKTLSINSSAKAAAGDELQSALTAVGKQCYFTDQIPANEYVPFLLADPSFPYFTLSNGSAIKLTYKEAKGLPEEIGKVAAAETYVVSNANYQEAYESSTDYAAAYAPSYPASRFIPRVLKAQYADAAAGTYVIVNYNQASTDPVFSRPDEPVKPGFEMSNVIASAKNKDNVTINGVVSYLATNGFILTDASGDIFVWCGNDFATNGSGNLKRGDQIVLDGVVSVNNYGKQISLGATYDVEGNQAVTYPTPTVLTGAAMDAIATEAASKYSADKNSAKNDVLIEPYYVKVSGTVKVSGSNINILVDGATTAQCSPYGASNDVKAMLTDGSTVTAEGYCIAIAGRKYLSIVMTSVNGTATYAALRSRAGESEGEENEPVKVAAENLNAVYMFDGTTWAPAANTVALSHADYQAMGQSYDNLSGEGPDMYLPTFLAQKFPYAQEGDVKYVAYAYYADKKTTTRCGYFIYTDGQWKTNDGVETVTSQFVKANGKWMYDPNVTIVLPAGRGIEISTLYFQTCVDWVKANVPDGSAYISSYGNNEYYCGTSAYQGNVDLRASAAKAQYAGYADMSDEAVVALEKERFESEVFPAALSILHPDAEPIPGMQVLYTINFAAYEGVNPAPTYDIVYEVVGKGKFQFVSCTWND